jgi:hypothetical protein
MKKKRKFFKKKETDTPKKEKINTCTLSNGDVVYAKEIDGKLQPLEFDDLIHVEKFTYKLFMKGYQTKHMRSFFDTKKYFIVILNDDITS